MNEKNMSSWNEVMIMKIKFRCCDIHLLCIDILCYKFEEFYIIHENLYYQRIHLLKWKKVCDWKKRRFGRFKVGRHGILKRKNFGIVKRKSKGSSKGNIKWYMIWHLKKEKVWELKCSHYWTVNHWDKCNT